MNIRPLVLITHRWLGLATSLILIIAGATGAMHVLGSPGDFRRSVGRIHENLALGDWGVWLVVAATAGAVLLQLGGVILWWKRKTLRVRTGAGWRATVNDLHHAAGMIGLLLMLLIAVTGVAMMTMGPGPTRRLIVDYHTSRRFPLAVDIVYAIGSLGFVLQGITGILMWARKR